MKTTVGIIILVIVCAGLVVALVAGKKTADTRQQKDAATIQDFSNQLDKANLNLDELRQVNLIYSNDLDSSRQTMMTFSNQYVAAFDSLSNTEAALKTAQDQIAELEERNRNLDQQAANLTNTIANLSSQIAETQMKLMASETNNAFLESELKRQMAQRAELERRFNDLSQVRAQVRKLKDEMLVARRLKWMREGTDPAQQRKGAELLMAHATPQANRNVGPAQYDLNVEVSSDGSVHVVPTTNAAAMDNAPSQ